MLAAIFLGCLVLRLVGLLPNSGAKPEVGLGIKVIFPGLMMTPNTPGLLDAFAADKAQVICTLGSSCTGSPGVALTVFQYQYSERKSLECPDARFSCKPKLWRTGSETSSVEVVLGFCHRV